MHIIRFWLSWINQSGNLESLMRRENVLAFDRSLARQCTWDRFRINEETCQVDTLVWFSWYIAVIARWGMARWNSNEVSLTMHLRDGAVDAQRAQSHSNNLALLFSFTPVRSWFRDDIFYDSSCTAELSLVNALMTDKKIDDIVIFRCFPKILKHAKR